MCKGNEITMKIISHRGYWLKPEERNTEIAFERSFKIGFGTETDLRDFNGEIVISHDMPTGNEITLHDFLVKYSVMNIDKFPLALNIKSDGLVQKLKIILEQFKNVDAFVFDMSIPDTRGYMDAEIPFFTRMSEVEKEPAWLEKAEGIWLDSFGPTWYDHTLIQSLIFSEKRLCVVSPELHGRDFKDLWSMLLKYSDHSNLILCTDHPETARNFFNI